MQTRLQSLLESFANIFIGWVVSVLSSAIIFPLLGVDLPWEANLKASAFLLSFRLFEHISFVGISIIDIS